MFDGDDGIAVLSALRGLGVTLAIDDFGTGHSNLSTLRRYPVDTLKIDRAFVEGVDSDGDAVAIVRAIVAVARALDLRVTAEGVERATQAEILHEIGCDWGQGYLYARPVPAAAIPSLVATGGLLAAVPAAARLSSSVGGRGGATG